LKEKRELKAYNKTGGARFEMKRCGKNLNGIKSSKMNTFKDKVNKYNPYPFVKI